jgi:hypothetical protein
MDKTIPHNEPYIAPSSIGVVIRKNGYFYRPEWCGYTASIEEAGRYDQAVAERHAANTEGVTVHQISEFSEALAPALERARRAVEQHAPQKEVSNG